MAVNWTAEQIMALAPDTGSVMSGKELASPRKWVSLGHNDAAAWGLCRGSGAQPYQAQVDLSEPAFRCTCPSRKFPCKHSLGLFLLLVGQPEAFTETTPPAWVSEWLEKRSQSSEQVATRKKAKAESPTPDAKEKPGSTSQVRQVVQREKRVAQGLDELTVWLKDLVQNGLASAQNQPVSYWEARAARMVDAQAPGVARMIRSLPGVAVSGSGWQGRLLEQVGQMYLLAEGYRRIESLPPQTQADIRATIGWTQSQEELLAGEGVKGRWLVLGQYVEEEDRLRVNRIWLWEQDSGRSALVLQFAYSGQPLPGGFAAGTCIDAEVVYFPGSYPQRALVKERHGSPMPIENVAGTGIASAIEAYASTIACNPWLERFSMLLSKVVPAGDGTEWRIRDEEGYVLPISPRFQKGWDLLSVSGGHPITVFGEWNGTFFLPLGAWCGRYIRLTL